MSVAEDHEEKDGGHESQVRLVAVFPDDGLCLVLDKLVHHFCQLLYFAGLLHIQREAYQDEEEQQPAGHHQLQGLVEVNGSLGVVGVNTELQQQAGDWAAKQVVQNRI